MARALDISEDVNKEKLRTFLCRAVQSAHLNFIIGSGCSAPAIQTLGNIESEVQSLIDEEKRDEATRLLYGYLLPFLDSVNLLKGRVDEKHKAAIQNYGSFLETISEILFERKSSIAPRQASIFTTNYDLFIESAFESFKGPLTLNDGFDRRPSLHGRFGFTTAGFFDSVYRSGNLYDYEVQIPAVNLVKLHGSLSWLSDGEEILFSVDHLGQLKEESEQVEVDGDIVRIRDIVSRFSVILPNTDKLANTLLSQIHYDLLRIYANALDRENTLLLTDGFSFEDAHIWQITKRGLRNPTLRLVIFCFEEPEVEDYLARFGEHDNVDIVYSGEGHIEFERFVSILKEVSPRKRTKRSADTRQEEDD